MLNFCEDFADKLGGTETRFVPFHNDSNSWIAIIAISSPPSHRFLRIGAGSVDIPFTMSAMTAE